MATAVEDVRWAETTNLPDQFTTLLSVPPDPNGTFANTVDVIITELFFRDCGREAGSDLFMGRKTGLAWGRRVYIDAQQRLCYFRNGVTALSSGAAGIDGEGFRENQVNVLAQFIGERYNGGFVLLNGDGFMYHVATRHQDRVRERARGVFGVDRALILPFEAMNAARIDPSTIQPIYITEDTNDRLDHEVSSPPGWSDEDVAYVREHGGGIISLGFLERLYDTVPLYATPPGAEWTTWAHLGRVTTEDHLNSHSGDIVFEHEGRRWRCIWRERSSAQVYADFYIYAALLDGEGEANWQHIVLNPDRDRDRPPFYWQEQRHRLGASVFSANGFDGRRHRFISAFDQHEPEPLYYLAQLPDKGQAETYDDAIALLAPPIVHEARKQGKHVERQGDVFAIETALTSRQVYARAKLRVRRSVVIQSQQRVTLNPVTMPDEEQHLEWRQPRKGEIAEYVVCPGCGNHRMKVGFGPKARRALMIFGTSHTATEVVVCEGGVTFVKGMLHHDPQLEEPDRRPEHINRQLTEGKWYLAVRNTVPRQGARRVPSQDAQAQALQEQDQPDLQVAQAAAAS